MTALKLSSQSFVGGICSMVKERLSSARCQYGTVLVLSWYNFVAGRTAQWLRPSPDLEVVGSNSAPAYSNLKGPLSSYCDHWQFHLYTSSRIPSRELKAASHVVDVGILDNKQHTMRIK